VPKANRPKPNEAPVQLGRRGGSPRISANSAAGTTKARGHQPKALSRSIYETPSCQHDPILKQIEPKSDCWKPGIIEYQCVPKRACLPINPITERRS
jgi:hypothetical protein